MENLNRDNSIQISHIAVNDTSLSCEGFWLLSYAISKPDDWQFNATQLRKQKGFCREKMSKILKELEDKKYLFKKAVSLGRGKRFLYRWFWCDEKFKDEDIDYFNSLNNQEPIKFNKNLEEE